MGDSSSSSNSASAEVSAQSPSSISHVTASGLHTAHNVPPNTTSKEGLRNRNAAPAVSAYASNAATTATLTSTTTSTTAEPSRHHRSTPSDPSRLAPEDAFFAGSPPRRERRHSPLGLGAMDGAHGAPRLAATTAAAVGGSIGSASGTAGKGRKARRDAERGRSGSRRRKGVWKKLLWVKQSYPDNYTDEDTFLDHLQRNPSLQPYEFWSLVADLTVIVQHVCSVSIFLCCFTAIFRRQISPLSVVVWATLATVLGWIIWDVSVSREKNQLGGLLNEADGEDGGSNRVEAMATTTVTSSAASVGGPSNGGSSSSSPTTTSMMGVQMSDLAPMVHGLGLQINGGNGSNHPTASTNRQPKINTKDSNSIHPNSPSPNLNNAAYVAPAPSPLATGHPTGAPTFANYSTYPPYKASASYLSPRNQQRLATLKSAALIFCALLGLSPILKSLTQAWTDDSIWAMACGLVCINVFFFDYSGGQAKLPASFSMNAAVMASTVLASRLHSTTHVFSLSLFSVEVFALFPIFRRYLRLISWRGHVALTVLLVMGAGGSVGLTVASRPGWGAAVGGIVLGDVFTMLAMGVTSWWLIGLQKYKNEIHGPWDPARPVVRRRWD